MGVNTWLAACCTEVMLCQRTTPPLLPKLGLDWTTNSILCTPSELSFTGTSEKVWKKVSSLKPEKIWPLWRKITKRSESTPLKASKKKKTNSKFLKSCVYEVVIRSQ